MARPAFSLTSRVVAALLLLVSLVGTVHRQQDDDACLPISATEHDDSKHAYAPLEPVEHEHCAVCHWIRALKPDFSTTPAAIAGFDQSADLAASAARMHRAPCGAQLPARAPPATV